MAVRMPFLRRIPIDQSIASLLDIVQHTNDIAVAVGLPMRHNNRTFDAACLIANKRILGFAVKQYLANNGVHYEIALVPALEPLRAR